MSLQFWPRALWPHMDQWRLVIFIRVYVYRLLAGPVFKQRQSARRRSVRDQLHCFRGNRGWWFVIDRASSPCSQYRRLVIPNCLFETKKLFFLLIIAEQRVVLIFNKFTQFSRITCHLVTRINRMRQYGESRSRNCYLLSIVRRVVSSRDCNPNGNDIVRCNIFLWRCDFLLHVLRQLDYRYSRFIFCIWIEHIYACEIWDTRAISLISDTSPPLYSLCYVDFCGFNIFAWSASKVCSDSCSRDTSPYYVRSQSSILSLFSW